MTVETARTGHPPSPSIQASRPPDGPATSTAWAGRRSGHSPIGRYLERRHERHRQATDGAVATYIPELGRADPAWFGIAAVTLDGTVHAVGDATIPFSIQSISKPLTYGLVLDDLGESAVRARIGVEPTGEPFNAITLAPGTGMPLNPMVNAGAITAVGLLAGRDGMDPLDRLLAGFGRFVGHPVAVDADVYESERVTGHRNRAIAQLLRASGAIDGDPDAVVERYFAQCSVAVTAVDLAVIAATLADGGRHPLSGETVLSAVSTRAVLAVMGSCGMYDGAGEWLYTVGLPAKSGVSGGLLVVVPGRLGIGVFSPPLDANGNTVRGVRVLRDLVRDLGLHPLGGDGPRPDAIRASYRLADVGSKRRRSPAQRAVLTRAGRRCLVVELQGSLSILAPDAIGALLDDPDAGDALELLVLDLGRVTRVDPAAIDLLGDLVASLTSAGTEVILAGRHRLALHIPALERAIGQAGSGLLDTTDDLDRALELAEDRALVRAEVLEVEMVGLADQALVAGLGPRDLATVASRLERTIHRAGSWIVRRGDAADALFLIERGRASVSVELTGGGRRRLSTLGPGMAFGEAALLDVDRRSADVHADSEVATLAIARSAFDTLLRDEPAVAAVLLRNLLASVGATAARLTGEVAVLAG